MKFRVQGIIGVVTISMILIGCTAGGTLQAPNLADALPQDALSDDSIAATAASTAAAGSTAAAAAKKEPNGGAQLALRPSGVPKLRPGSAGLAPAIENALIPKQNPNKPALAAAEQLARDSTKPKSPTQSLFARLTSGKSTDPVAANTPGSNSRSVPNPRPAASSADSNIVAKANDVSGGQPGAKTNKTKKKKSGFFANLFQGDSPKSSRTATVRSGVVSTRTNRTRRARLGWDTSALPGVRGKKDIFGIDIDEGEELDEGIKLASVTNRARRGSHGLLLQREDVKVGCFPPQLIRLLKQVERRFGRTPIITSGYRSRAYNKRIRGARNSMHIHCKAADIQVQGVSKRKLARYLRSLPGRGGVGTYCHTKSVHLDVGKKRDWNRRCRRRRTRKT